MKEQKTRKTKEHYLRTISTFRQLIRPLANIDNNTYVTGYDTVYFGCC